jgi:predicted MPP superfamily phosphohydrolase
MGELNKDSNEGSVPPVSLVKAPEATAVEAAIANDSSEIPEPSVGRHFDYLKKAGRVVGRTAIGAAGGLVGAGVTLGMLPVHTTVEGVPFEIQGSMLHHTGGTVDTTFGTWGFPNIDRVPIGVHVRPDNVNVLAVAKDASPDTRTYVSNLQKGFKNEMPEILAKLSAEVVVGAASGAALADMLLRYAFLRQGRRQGEWRHQAKQLTAVVTGLAAAVGYGVLTYNPDWYKDSYTTGTLAEAQQFPSQLAQFYDQESLGASKGADVLNGIIGIQSALQEQIDEKAAPATAYNVMYISDMHLNNEYSRVETYVENFNVKLIINTGDESEFGSTGEMTTDYINKIKEVTKKVPMIWVAGNHDSADTVKVMQSIPGVHVLGIKDKQPDGTFKVGAQVVKVYGLDVGGIPDPRGYGAPGVYGSDVDKVTDKLENTVVDDALKGTDPSLAFDIFATHEPVAANRITSVLPGRVRQTNAGHTHAQNDDKSIQSGSNINLVEGSTGAGGLDTIHSTTKPHPPIELTIESVAPNCEFTKLSRFAITETQLSDNISSRTIYLKPQKLKPLKDGDGRICSVVQGIGPVESIIPVKGTPVQAEGGK